MKTCALHRGGWTLIELMVVIALMALVLSGSATLLTAVLRSQSSLWADLQEQSARTRLAAQLRADAHPARSVRCASPQVCDFELAGGETVHYEIKGNSLLRERRQSEAVSERESFPLNGLSAAFSVDATRQRPLIRLSMKAVPEERKYSGIARPSILEAAVGIRASIAARGSQP